VNREKEEKKLSNLARLKIEERRWTGLPFSAARIRVGLGFRK